MFSVTYDVTLYIYTEYLTFSQQSVKLIINELEIEKWIFGMSTEHLTFSQQSVKLIINEFKTEKWIFGMSEARGTKKLKSA